MSRKYRFLFGLILLIVLSINGVATGIPQKADELVETKDVVKINKAIVMLESLIAENPLDGDALWVLSKAHVFLGDRSPKSDKLQLYEKGKVYAEKAVTLMPDSPDAHFWLGTITGRIGQTKGVLQSLFMVNPLKERFNKVLALDPNYAMAYLALSILYAEAPGRPLSIGDNKKSLEKAKKAAELKPDDVEINVNLAQILINNKKIPEAVFVLEKVLAMPDIDTEPEFKSEATRLLIKYRT